MNSPQKNENFSSLTLPVWILALFALGLLFHNASNFFIWIAFSFLLLALLDPWMRKLNARGFAPILSAIVLVGAVTMFCFATIAFIYYISPKFLSEFDVYRQTFMGLYEHASEIFRLWVNDLTHVTRSDQVVDTVSKVKIAKVQVVDQSPFSSVFTTTMLHGLNSAIIGITFVILCPILTFFLIAEQKTFASMFTRLYPEAGQASFVWKKVTDSTTAFFLGNLILLGISFPIFVVLFYVFGVSAPLPLAFVASVFNLIPFLGAVLTGLIPALDILSHEGSMGLGIALMASCLLVHFLVANLVTPKILGSKVDINATTSTIVLIAWGELWGPFGLLLAIPITSVIKILFENSGNHRLRWIAMLMSDNTDTFLNQAYKPLALRKPSAPDDKKEEP